MTAPALGGRIDDFRDGIDRKLSPSNRHRLKRELDEAFTRASRRVRRKMQRYSETQAAATLPAQCPSTLEQVLGVWLREGAPPAP